MTEMEKKGYLLQADRGEGRGEAGLNSSLLKRGKKQNT